MGALDGIKVADFTRWLSGPTLTMLLADLGADVVKVESLPHGDPSREPGPFLGDQSVYFMSANRNKRSLAVDLHSEQGRQICGELASKADVVAQNFRPGVAESLGLGYEALRAGNSRLIYCSISGFGNKGPGSALPGFDQTAQAMSGLMSVTGTAATGPLRVGIPIGDSSTGVLSAVGVLAALYEREHTGHGQHVETSLMASLLFLMTYQAQRFLSVGEIPGQDGNDHPMAFPQGTFSTRDGFITIATGNNKMWANLCAAIGLNEFVDDARFVDNRSRMKNRTELRALIEGALGKRDSEEWIIIVNRAGIPCGPVLDIGQAMGHSITENLDMVERVVHSSLGEVSVLGTPLKFDGGQRPWLRLPPPLLGEHSVDICRELGYSDSEIDELIRQRTILAATEEASRRPT